MMVAVQKNSTNTHNTKKFHHLPLQGEAKAHTKSNSASVNLRSDPNDVDSQRYKLTILRLSGGEDVRTIIQWRNHLVKIQGGLNLGPVAEYKVICTIMSGTPQTTFEARVLELKTAAMETVIAAITNNAAVAQRTARAAMRARGADRHLSKLHLISAVAHTVKEMMLKKILASLQR